MSAAPVSLSSDSVMFPCCGGEVVIPCRVEGSPPLYYCWAREDALDVNVSKYELLEDGSLRIHSLSVSDEGLYVCVVSSPLGGANSTINLTSDAGNSICIPFSHASAN